MQKEPTEDFLSAAGATIGRDSAAHFELFWRELMDAGNTFKDEHAFRMITGEQHPLGNFAILTEPCPESHVEKVVQPLLALEAPSAVFFMAPPSEAVTGQLGSMGFVQLDPMPAMAVEIDALAAAELPPGYESVRVVDGKEASDWTDILAMGYPIPRGLAHIISPESLPTTTAIDADVQFFGVGREGRLVATSMLYLAGGLAGVYCVATLPEERGMGLGAHVTAEALRAAGRAGYKVGVLQSSDAGHSIYLALGFADVGEVHMFMRSADTDT